ncbi:hypothetical protein COLO4_26118 [Corchorus olitorius]|uniref:Protein kinase domain-containing protein n=1 Tax=Corchorus olitorius TaxID=93759 RepID=A0A1R3HYJ5_9ROSI|nr:hypothetical protein COLO4_26118 [Corchorus olitorius]
MAVFIERNSEEALWSRISNSSYFVNQLPTIGALLAARKGKIILELEIPTLYHLKEDIIGHDSSSFSHNPKAILLNSISIIRRELPEPSLGWPLLRRKKSSPNQIEIIKPEARDKSVVEWVMNLPNRVITVVNQSSLDSTIKDCEAEEAIQKSEEDSQSDMIQNPNEENSELEYDAEVSVSLKTNVMDTNSKPGWPLLRITPSTTSDSFSTESENPVETEIFLPALRKMPKDLELRCKQFSLRELKQATSEFSAENLIGEGGCSKVYKGCLPDGKPVAVKILKSYKEAWSDFCLEVDIVSSLEHKHITPLVGVCVEDDHIISVYDFFPNGSLEEVLHGQSQKSVLPWRVRFKVATAIAKALSYLHNECSPPVIHRDVKSSNILLSDDFQPQLSDFGLAIWGPTDSTYMIDSNVVGTFGYIAPEYFMQGRVSEKIDVYSFGVVLLELLSGRKPINSKAPEGQQSLIQWAKTLLEKKNLQELLDPALDGDFDIAQMQRMVLAAFLCLNELDVTRPKISQVFPAFFSLIQFA